MIVLVTGLPGSGKTTLARQLASGLGLALLSLDSVKEALVDGLADAAPADRFVVRRAARAVLARLAAEQPGGCVVEVWLNPTRDESDFHGGFAGLADDVREVVCLVPAETAIARYADRDRHPAHLPPDDWAFEQIRNAAPHIGPVGLGPALTVDTSTPVDDARLTEVLAWLRS